MKLNHGFRSRSHRVVQDSSVASAIKKGEKHEGVFHAGSSGSCWENIPFELLREVLTRIEATEIQWPPRRTVVVCAEVCRSWRGIMKEIVGTPEVSGKLTFPISVKQPGPRETLVQCYIKRNRATQTYYLYLGLTQALADNGKFLLAARKIRRPTCTDYIISLNANHLSRGSDNYIGKLRSNFLGTKFTIYDGLAPHSGAKFVKSHSMKPVDIRQISPRVSSGDHPVAHISYELNVWGSRGPRKMQCMLDAIPASSIFPGGVAPTQTEIPLGNASPTIIPFFRSRSKCTAEMLSGPLVGEKNGSLVLKNKTPRWHEQLQCWCLNFHGRVTVASVKNFQLVASAENGQAGPEHEKIILQFGKVGKDVFTMDYRYPISAFQAFGICLSSFDTKIACE